MSLAIGTRLGPYEILEAIGAGGMGEVYRARDTRLHRVVAIKILPEHLSSRPQLRERFQHEARAVSSLNHAHICTLYDVGSEGGVDYAVMEYLEGETLAQWLKKGPFATEQALKYAVQITDALDSAHVHGLIHRDVKPANIMVSPTGNVKVMDFGIAKRFAPGQADGFPEPQSTTMLTQPGAITGTLAYMSPEQLRNEPLDPRSDLFALGVMLYEMLTGKHPFQKKSTLETASAILNETPTPALQLNPNLPSGLEQIIDKSLKKDPDLRYESAANMRADLEKLKRLTESHTEVSVRQLDDTTPVRRWRWVVVATLALSAVALGAYFFRKRIVESPKHPIHIAVLAFSIASGDATLNFVSDVLREGLSFRLSRLDGLRLPSDADMEHVSKQGSSADVGQRLGVDHIMEGSINGNLEHLDISTTVNDLGSRRTLMERRFEGSDLTLIEDQICSAAAFSLGLEGALSEVKCRIAHPSFTGESYDLYLEGRKQMRSERVDQGLNLYLKAVQVDQTFALAYTGMVDAWLAKYRQTENQKWLDEASNAALKAQKLNDDLPEAHFALGAVYAARGHTMEAIVEIKKAIAITATDEGFRRLGEAYQENGQLKESINAFRSAVAMNPHYSNNFYHLGDALHQAGDLAQALVNFQRFRELEPESPLAYENIGAVYLDQGECEDAIPQFDQALKLKPEAEAFENLGNAFFCLKQYPQSVRAFERARTLSPNDTTYVGNLADAYRRAGRKDDSIRTYRMAIALAHRQLEGNPRNAQVMGDLALYYAKIGSKDDALTWIKRARSLSPLDVGLEYDLAVITAIAGGADQACATLLNAIKNGYSEKVARSEPELTPVLQSKNCTEMFEKFKGK